MRKKSFALFCALMCSAACSVRADVVLQSPAKDAVISAMPPAVNAYLLLNDDVRKEFFNSKDKRAMLFELREAVPYEFTWKCTKGETGAFQLDFAFDPEFKNPAKLTVLGSPSQVPGKQIVLENKAKVVNFEIGKTYYWKVTCQNPDFAGTVSAAGQFKTEDFAPRMLLIPGVKNTRDLGGWKTSDGKKVRQGLIYRTGGLNENSPDFEWKPEVWTTSAMQKNKIGKDMITPEGKKVVADTLQWKTEIDLRRWAEVGAMKNSPAGKSVNWVHIQFDCYDGLFKESFDVIDGKGPERLAQAFKLLCDKNNLPADFHCIAGTDRTGSLALILQAVLGVSKEDILKDWEISAYGYLKYRMLDVMFEELDKYGSETDSLKTKTENYLLKLGVTREEIETFRSIMLED